MKTIRTILLEVVMLPALTLLTPEAWSAALDCPADSQPVGTICADRYEASVWRVTNPDAHQDLLERIQAGTATLTELHDAGATQHGCVDTGSANGQSPFPPSFPKSGDWTEKLYAVSVAGVKPTACVSWFQANQACALSEKRLLTSEEWQRAAAGTPDPGANDDAATTCVTQSPVADTGTRAACMSSWGVFDMVGNIEEWVADWDELAGGCATWPRVRGNASSASALPGDDKVCIGNFSGSNSAPSTPGAFLRGGAHFEGTKAGVFAIDARRSPSLAPPPGTDFQKFGVIGFRCGREPLRQAGGSTAIEAASE